jgi:hypothetical protein
MSLSQILVIMLICMTVGIVHVTSEIECVWHSAVKITRCVMKGHQLPSENINDFISHEMVTNTERLLLIGFFSDIKIAGQWESLDSVYMQGGHCTHVYWSIDPGLTSCRAVRGDMIPSTTVDEMTSEGVTSDDVTTISANTTPHFVFRFTFRYIPGRRRPQAPEITTSPTSHSDNTTHDEVISTTSSLNYTHSSASPSDDSYSMFEQILREMDFTRLWMFGVISLICLMLVGLSALIVCRCLLCKHQNINNVRVCCKETPMEDPSFELPPFPTHELAVERCEADSTTSDIELFCRSTIDTTRHRSRSRSSAHDV